MEQLIRTLNEFLPQYVYHTFGYVNCGGCGIVAYHIAKELTEIGIDAEIAWLTYEEQLTEKNRQALNELLDKNDKTTSLYDVNMIDINCPHMMVRIKHGNAYWFVDATGAYDTLEESNWDYYEVLMYLPYHKIENIVNNTLGWNEMFDRRQVRGVKARIKEVVNMATVVVDKKYLAI